MFLASFFMKSCALRILKCDFQDFCSFVPMIVRFKNMVGFCSRIKEVEP